MSTRRAAWCWLALGLALPAPAAAPLPPVQAPSWIVMEHATGRVLAEQDADTPRPPASLTKIMTGYVVFEALEAAQVKPSDRARVSRKAWKAGSAGSRAFVRQGSRVRVDDLLRGMTVTSGNDSAMALAEGIGGSEAAFVARMNAANAALGLSNTRWANPTGLDHPEQRTTARDLAALARALIDRHPDLYAYYSIPDFEWDGVKQRNHNPLLASGTRKDGTPYGFAGADGVKTGFTKASGFCIVGSALRDGRRLIVVLLGSANRRSRAQDAQALLAWGFAELGGTAAQPLLDSTVTAPAR
jgi:D-alanyl-D-alanine carboxypeptidase (penicillin-binding protein 5/6)